MYELQSVWYENIFKKNRKYQSSAVLIKCPKGIGSARETLYHMKIVFDSQYIGGVVLENFG